mmetsp:Transcript_9584/g.27621  ORF Transcript_9584/g.27621 Transcript_9584/m.27621 type:complete len:248 (-) Transcript_9584:108-851(-)
MADGSVAAAAAGAGDCCMASHLCAAPPMPPMAPGMPIIWPGAGGFIPSAAENGGIGDDILRRSGWRNGGPGGPGGTSCVCADWWWWWMTAGEGWGGAGMWPWPSARHSSSTLAQLMLVAACAAAAADSLSSSGLSPCCRRIRFSSSRSVLFSCHSWVIWSWTVLRNLRISAAIDASRSSLSTSLSCMRANACETSLVTCEAAPPMSGTFRWIIRSMYLCPFLKRSFRNSSMPLAADSLRVLVILVKP